MLIIKKKRNQPKESQKFKVPIMQVSVRSRKIIIMIKIIYLDIYFDFFVKSEMKYIQPLNLFDQDFFIVLTDHCEMKNIGK